MPRGAWAAALSSSEPEPTGGVVDGLILAGVCADTDHLSHDA